MSSYLFHRGLKYTPLSCMWLIAVLQWDNTRIPHSPILRVYKEARSQLRHTARNSPEFPEPINYGIVLKSQKGFPSWFKVEVSIKDFWKPSVGVRKG